MACGLLFSLIWRKKIATVGLMLWVAMNCYSRMYLGVHYPLDIIGGLLVGALMAVVGYVLLRALGVVSRGDDVVQSNCKVSVENEVGNPIGDS
jgi:membrane-associated phospholipid phosphatase